jgi:hypothetical protein
MVAFAGLIISSWDLITMSGWGKSEWVDPLIISAVVGEPPP